MPFRDKRVLNADHQVLLIDSITQLMPTDGNVIVVTGSHGGLSIVEYALRVPLRAVFFNDAGVGKDQAGIRALAIFNSRGIPAAAYSHMSARIGEARDAWENGVISHANERAQAKGIAAELTVQHAAMKLD